MSTAIWHSIAAAVAALVLGASTAGAGGPVFEEYPWRPDTPDVRTERLCAEAADPDHAPDTTFLHCATEGATFAQFIPEVEDEVLVVAWNILRGFEATDQIALLLDGSTVPTPDVLLLSEVDRGCARTQFRNVARDFAEALGYYYVFGVEFVELPGVRGYEGPYAPPLCEHGNAIVSRWPLGNVRHFFHARNRSWYSPPEYVGPGEPRLGGRAVVAADMKVGDGLVRLYTLHLESTVDFRQTRDAQSWEVVDDAKGVAHPVIVGGDLNVPGGSFWYAILGVALDGPTYPFFRRGFADAHQGLPLAERITANEFLPLILDYLFVRGADVLDRGVCPFAVCGALSDHEPVWARVGLR